MLSIDPIPMFMRILAVLMLSSLMFTPSPPTYKRKMYLGLALSVKLSIRLSFKVNLWVIKPIIESVKLLWMGRKACTPAAFPDVLMQF